MGSFISYRSQDNSKMKAVLLDDMTLKTDIYDLADGSVQVYVCIEMREKEEAVLDDVKNNLGRDGVIENQYDRDRFAEKMQTGLEEYKKKRNAE